MNTDQWGIVNHQPYLYTTGDFDFRTPEQKQMDDENELKVQINTFVWTHAPNEMTLGKADEMACKILELFIEARESLRTKEPVASSEVA